MGSYPESKAVHRDFPGKNDDLVTLSGGVGKFHLKVFAEHSADNEIVL